MSKPKPKRMAVKLLLLLLIFTAPLIAALFIYQSRDNLHFLSKNAGELIIPSTNLSKLNLGPLENRWWLAYYTPGDCKAKCIEVLNHFNTIQQSLVKEQNRIGALLITTQAQASLPPNLLYAKKLVFKGPLPANLLLENQNTAIWIIDPLGNIILGYDPNTLDNLILLDLRHLLKVSQIG